MEIRDNSADTLGGTEVYAGRDLEALADLPNYYDWIVSRFAPYLRGDGIEIGAGVGTVSSRVCPALDSLELVEPSDNLTSQLRLRFSDNKKIKISAISLEERLANCDSGAFDTAIMVNVLEHIEDDGDALLNLHRVLRTGGHLLLFVPAIPALYSAFDREVGHYRRYRRSELGSRLKSAGFEVISNQYMDLLGVVPWWLIQTVGGSVAINPAMAKIYDTFGVPLTRAIERLLPAPVGKNLVAVARRNPAPS